MMPNKKQIPFEPKFSDKREFRTWVLDQFPELGAYRLGALVRYPALEKRLPEIHAAAMKVLNRILTTYDQKDAMHRYYKPDHDRLEKAFEERDVKGYADSLDDLLGSIEWE